MNVREMSGSSAAPPTTASRSRPPSRASTGAATFARNSGASIRSSGDAAPCATR